MHHIYGVFRRLLRVLPGGTAVRQSAVVEAIRRFLASRLRREEVIVHGHRMFLDPEDNLELSIRGVHEPVTTEIFRKVIREGDTVLDIGAHIGYYTLLAARLVGEKGKVFAFEPNPNNFEILRRNVEANGYKNVVLVPKAVSDTSGKAKLFLERDANTRWSSIYDIHEGGRSLEVDVTTIDEFLEGYGGAIDFIKLDVEGAEVAALQGMTDLIARGGRLRIVAEFRPALLERAGLSSGDLLDFFIAHGFKLYYADDVHEVIKPAEKDDVIRFCEEHEAADLLCVRDAA